MRDEQIGDLRFGRFESLGDGVLAVVTQRAGGVSTGPYASLNLGDHVGDDPDAVLENRRRVAVALGVGPLTIADQQHGARAVRVGSGAAAVTAALTAVDGLHTDVPGVALAVLVADCQPIVLHDPVRRAVGVAHAGRPGTIAGIVPAVVQGMVDAYGTDPATLRVGIGPHVARPSYEVGPAEVAAATSAFPHLDLCTPTRDGHAHLDLELAVVDQLHRLSVPDESIERAGIDTRTSTDTYFSDRAERPCGRFALVAVLTNPS